jgi:arylsulfatase
MHTIKLFFAFDGGRGGGGKATIYRDGVKTGEGSIKHTNANVFSMDDFADVGMDLNTLVYPGYRFKDRFTGKIASVTIETFRAQ